MNPIAKWYAKFSRYSTLVLGAITIILGAYVWFNRTQVYYQTYCEQPENVEFQQRYSNYYDCDTAVIEYLKQQGAQCLKAGCRRIEE